MIESQVTDDDLLLLDAMSVARSGSRSPHRGAWRSALRRVLAEHQRLHRELAGERAVRQHVETMLALREQTLDHLHRRAVGGIIRADSSSGDPL